MSFRCPKCQSIDQFKIYGINVVTFTVGADEDIIAEEATEAIWDDDDAMSCQGCGHEGEVADFTPSNQGMRHPEEMV